MSLPSRQPMMRPLRHGRNESYWSPEARTSQGRDARSLSSGQQGEDPGDGGGAGAYAQTGKGVLQVLADGRLRDAHGAGGLGVGAAGGDQAQGMHLARVSSRTPAA